MQVITPFSHISSFMSNSLRAGPSFLCIFRTEIYYQLNRHLFCSVGQKTVESMIQAFKNENPKEIFATTIWVP